MNFDFFMAILLSFKLVQIARFFYFIMAWFFGGRSWKKKYSGLGASDLRKLRQLEEENLHLKQLVADLSLDKQMLQDVLKKSFETSPA